MNTMRNGGVVTMRKDGLPYDEMGYVPPPNRKLPPVPGTNSNYNTIDRIKKGEGEVGQMFRCSRRRQNVFMFFLCFICKYNTPSDTERWSQQDLS